MNKEKPLYQTYKSLDKKTIKTYIYCPLCLKEIKIHSDICEHCDQPIDWGEDD